MSKFSSVMQSIHAGSQVRIVLDPYGQKQVEVYRTWLPIRRRFRLRREEISMVEIALNVRSLNQRSHETVRI